MYAMRVFEILLCGRVNKKYKNPQRNSICSRPREYTHVLVIFNLNRSDKAVDKVITDYFPYSSLFQRYNRRRQSWRCFRAAHE